MNRRKARDRAFKMLFEYDFKSDTSPMDFYTENTEGDEDAREDEYIKTAFFGVLENLEAIDEKIGNNSKRWDKKRISKVAMNIMRLSVFEIENMEDVPANISINEAVALAKKYETEKVPEFINGVLGAIVKENG